MKKIILIVLSLVLLTGVFTACTQQKDINVQEVVDAVYMSSMEGKDDWLSEAPKETLTQAYSMDFTEFEEFYGKMPLMNTQASAIFGAKAVKGKEETVKTELTKFKEGMEKSFESYLPDQYEVAKNGTIIQEGQYIFLVLYEDVNSVSDAIKEQIK